MPTAKPKAARVVLKGLVTVGRRVTLDAGSGVVTLTFPRGSKAASELRSGHPYYVWGRVRGSRIEVTAISSADATLSTDQGLDHGRFAQVMATLAERRAEWLAKAGVLQVRAGYAYVGGWTTHTPAVVVTYDPTKPVPDIPVSTFGVPIELRAATAADVLSATQSLAPRWAREAAMDEPVAVPGWELDESAPAMFALAAATRLRYVAPPDAPLDAVTETCELVCHASPDAGWPILDAFLVGAARTLTIAMYDFTAPHIAKTVATLAGLRALTLVLDPGESLSAPGTFAPGADVALLAPSAATATNPKAFDQHETTIVASLERNFGKRFTFAWAAVARAGKTTQGIFPTAYHIKVAVADGQAMWLSSGNWQSSNQPDFPALTASTPHLADVFKTYNREWHVVARAPALSALFETYIKWDRTQAAEVQVHPMRLALPEDAAADTNLLAPVVPTVHPPRVFKRRFTIQPLLTPDNYLEHVSALIGAASRSLRIQNQYIKLPARGGQVFIDFLTLLRDKGRALGEGFKVIVRDLPGLAQQLDALEHFGFDMNRFKRQANTHNKGIVIDDEILVIGSHNWSNQGVLENRDASLVIRDREVAAYYAAIFDHDWQVLARQRALSPAGS